MPKLLDHVIERADRICKSLSASVWFSYLSIVLLQLKVIWEVWRVRDLSSGDTSYYFLTAHSWFKDGSTLITWSPLYTAFYGAFLHLSSDAAFITRAHRLTIVLVLAVLVLAVMRKFLPNLIAWFMAAWWVVLPIDFDALYEVHLFSLIPLLLTILTATGGTRIHRGWALACLIATGLLMRNEILIAAVAFAIFILVYEIRQLRTKGSESASFHLFRSYGLPLVAVLLVTLFFYNRATDPPLLASMLARKHSLNICQTYAFGYQQRHNDWTQSPWTECQSLMKRQFGAQEPSLMEAITANPSAMTKHFGWNVLLIPNGLQMLLFDCMSGKMNPDYVPSTSEPLLAGILSIILLSLLIGGSQSLAGREHSLLTFEIDQRAWGWLVLGCLSAVTLMVIVMQRPRPSYMFPLGITIRVITGFCILSLLPRFSWLPRIERYFGFIAILLIALTPGYYVGKASPVANSLSTIYERLRPFEGLFGASDVHFSAVGWVPEVCNYLAKTVHGCKSASYIELTKQVSGPMTLGKVLNKEGINLFYAEETVFSDPAGRAFVTDPSNSGWNQIAFEDLPGRRWMLFKKGSWQKGSESSLAEIIHKGQGISLGSGWFGFETFRGDTFRWVENDADIQVGGHEDQLGFLVIDVEPGPGMALPIRLHISDGDGKDLTAVDLSARQLIKVRLGSASRESPRTFRLHVDGKGKPTPTDSRILNFRVLNVELAVE